MAGKPPATFGLTARGGKVILAVWRDQKLAADLEFTPRQWLGLVKRGSAIAEELMREEEGKGK